MQLLLTNLRSIQDVIDRILARLRETEKDAPARPLLAPPSRAPPETLPLFAGSE